MTETDIQRFAREIAAVDLTTCDPFHPTMAEYRLAHEVVRLRSILAALREPSAGVVEATAKALYLRGDRSQWCTWEEEIARYKETYYDDALPLWVVVVPLWVVVPLIRAAVAAAEKETTTTTPPHA